MKFTEGMLAAPLPEDIQKLKWYGDFEVALRVIDKRLKTDIPEALKERLRAEREILQLMPEQYPYSWDEALKIMEENVADFAREEFQELWEENAMEWIYIQGRVHFKDNFLENLVKTREWLAKRLIRPELEAGKKSNAECLNQTISYMKEHGGISCRFRLRSTLQVEKEAEQQGRPVKVYLPAPVEYAQVKSFRLLGVGVTREAGSELTVPVRRVPVGVSCEESLEIGKNGEAAFWISREQEGRPEQEAGCSMEKENSGSTSFQAWLAPETADQRTVCIVGDYQKGCRFWIEYEYCVEMPYVDAYGGSSDGASAKGWIPKEEKDFPAHYLGEQLPHIHFTPYLKAITAEIVGEETEPLKKARRIYDYITTHLMYSYVRSYFTITELVDYAAAGWKGDCGIQALLFINMCRIAGVPARWQSGLYARPQDVGCHDWAMFYAEPYGWLFADCSFGGSAQRMGCEERRQFYFGNLDPYRMPACCQFQADFQPPFGGLRQDPYDNQRGEVEYPERCLGGDEFDTQHQIIEWEILESK
ncbi:MAG: transglutaminase-like domain-containing protein [Lachnospiraceae bacterium]|nr:transglutaminase-like domain-containing protein [Lachnospiraceae bacterium]